MQVDGDPRDRRRRVDRPYLLNAYYDQLHGELEVDFQRRLILDEHDSDMRITGYHPGDEIPENGVPEQVRARVERALLDANGKSASLVIVAPDMDHGDFTIGSIRFRDEGQAHRAEPIYFMKFVGATEDMERSINEWMVDIHPNAVEFEIQ